MENVEFEEERDLKKSPGYVYNFNKPSLLRKLFPKSRNKDERHTTVLLVVLAIVLFGATVAVLLKDRFSENSQVINPESLSPVEKFKLPENIRKYIK